MEFGLFYQLPAWPGQGPQQRYQETLDQIVLGDELGFDVAWLAEMHFVPEFSILPSPVVVGAAVAMRTRRIRIGIGVTLLPLHDPLRAAEDAATLDLLSNGRLEYGIGRGSRPQHFDGFGIALSEREGRFVEGLDVLERAWADAPLNYEGRFYRYDNVHVVPKPVQRPRPRLWVAANSDESAERAAQRGLAIMVTPITTAEPALRRRTDTYRRLRRERGDGLPERDIAVLVPMFVTDPAAPPRSDLEQSLMRYVRLTAQTMLGGYVAERAPGSTVPARAERLNTITYDEALREMAVVGDPPRVAERIEAIGQEYGAGQIICWFNPGGLVPDEEVRASMGLFMEQVHPHFR